MLGKPFGIRPFILITLFLMSLTLKASEKTNVILILTDDQGYGDLSFHGNPILNTPNIDQLAEKSIRLTDFHVDPTCAPTRAALLTGRYSHRTGVWHTISGGNHLRESETTMADVFKYNQYRTALFGKWHLGSNHPFRPMDRGYQEWFGYGDGGTGTTDDWFDNDRVDDVYWHNGKRMKETGFSTDLFFDKAISFIEESSSQKSPFFITLSTYLPHSPHTMPDKAVASKFLNKVNPYTAYFYAAIEHIDNRVGDVLATLKEQGLEENTLVIFMTDNGGTAGVNYFNAGMRGAKGSIYEGGHRVPLFMQWPGGGLHKGRNINELTAHVDILPTLIDLLNLKTPYQIEFDGESLSPLLQNKTRFPSKRTLFVESQRTFTSIKWENSVAMQEKWRLVNGQDLYNIATDPGQSNNIAAKHPEVIKKLRHDYNAFWKQVKPGDRAVPRFSLGHPDDTEVFLTASDLHAPDVPWNHAQIAKGAKASGSWFVNVIEKGTYRFEIRRWPREARAPISGKPTINKVIDAWDDRGGVSALIYGADIVELPVEFVRLNTGSQHEIKPVSNTDASVQFEVELDKGPATISAEYLNKDKAIISSSYYVYASKVSKSR